MSERFRYIKTATKYAVSAACGAALLACAGSSRTERYSNIPSSYHQTGSPPVIWSYSTDKGDYRYEIIIQRQQGQEVTLHSNFEPVIVQQGVIIFNALCTEERNPGRFEENCRGFEFAPAIREILPAKVTCYDSMPSKPPYTLNIPFGIVKLCVPKP